MNVPEDIRTIINDYFEQARIEREERERKQAAEEQARMERGKEQYQAWLDKQLERVPDYVREYYEGLSQDKIEDVLMSYGDERRTPMTHNLLFRVPGLGPIIFYTDQRNGVSWAACGAYRSSKDYDGEGPYWSMHFDYVIKCGNLPKALAEAEAQQKEYDQYLEEAVARREHIAEQDRRAEERLLEQAAEAHTAREAEQIEINELCQLIDHDPIARQVLRLYESIRDARHSSEEW